MTKIRPLRGLIYNTGKVGDISSVVAPPWDVISEDHERRLRESSPFNVINLISQHSPPEDVKQTFSDWIKDGCLVKEDKPCFYSLFHNFSHGGRKFTRRGIYALLKLEDLNSGRVIPHEKVFEKYHANRYRLIERCRANFSPVFMLYSDSSGVVEDAADSAGTLFSGIIGDEEFKFCRIAEDSKIEKIKDTISLKNLIIADGHHRYQAAWKYFQDNPSPENGFVLVFLANIESPELLILPTHRYFAGEASFKRNEERIREVFIVERAENMDEMFSLVGGPRDRHTSVLGIYESDDIYVLTLKDLSALEKAVPSGSSSYWKRLDTVVLEHLLKDMLSVGAGDEFLYSPDKEYLLNEYEKREKRGLICFLNPVEKESFKKICFNKEVMPQKTTYFYPKVPSGLVFHKFE